MSNDEVMQVKSEYVFVQTFLLIPVAAFYIKSEDMEDLFQGWIQALDFKAFKRLKLPDLIFWIADPSGQNFFMLSLHYFAI